MKVAHLMRSASLGLVLLSGAHGAARAEELSQPAAKPASDAVAEVVVVGRKKSESLQHVAAVIDVISAEKLEAAGVQNVTSLQALSPGLHIQTQGSGAFVYVRGIGSASLLGDPSVPVFLDGAYVGRGTATGGLFYDIGQVEVLKGPQGTLYGRNSTAGALVINSNHPRHVFEAAASAEFGSFDRVGLEGMVNLPLGETLALRVAAKSVKDDGYLSNGGDAMDDKGARVSLAWDPSQNFSGLLIADYYKKDGVTQSTVPVYSVAAPCSGSRFCTDDPWRTGEKASPVDVENYGVIAQLNWRFDNGATLSINPGLRRSFSRQVSFANAIVQGGTFQVDNDQKSLEVRLASPPVQRLTWMTGVNLHRDDTRFFQIIPGVAAGPGIVLTAYTDVPTYTTKAWAAFAESTFNATDQLRFTAAVRYTDEKKDQDGRGFVVFTSAPFPHGTPTNFFSLEGHYSKAKPTWKLSVEYDAAPSLLLYANAGTGYKAGGVNRERNNFPNPNIYKDETITAFAAGAKSKWLDGRLVLNGEAFAWSYEGRQNDVLAGLQSNPPPSQAQDIKTINLGKTDLYGADLTARYAIGSHGSLEGSVEYLHSQYDKNDPSNNFAASFAGPFVVEPGADLRGRPLAFSPKWAGTVAYEHKIGLGGQAVLTPRIETQFQTASYTQYRLAAQSRQPSYHKTNLSLTYDPGRGGFSVMAYVRNLEKEAVLRATSVSALTTGTPRYYGYIEEPRSAGVALRFRY